MKTEERMKAMASELENHGLYAFGDVSEDPEEFVDQLHKYLRNLEDVRTECGIMVSCYVAELKTETGQELY